MNCTTPNPLPFTQTYQPIRLLGKGGYGAVWLVKHVFNGTLRAAKIIPDSKCNRKTWCKDRSLYIPDEILLSETLEHPNLLELHELYFERNSWVLVMDYLPDVVDMFDYISKHGALSEGETRAVLTQLLDTCSYLISQDVDHRDIKLENILYNPTTLRIKLIDFGLASVLPDVPYRTCLGTELYLPPECFNKGCYSALPAMTWSIGCLAYVLLNGNLPFSTRKEVTNHRQLKFRNSKLNQETKEFLCDLLIADEIERMTPGEIIFHPWMGWIALE